ncbi:MAG: flagellar biosynthesis anti-sigma factor FlgM [Pseudohongiellaceae bacterium]|jgi:flagellar biosynthesis anti-sigma factor FlgM
MTTINGNNPAPIMGQGQSPRTTLESGKRPAGAERAPESMPVAPAADEVRISAEVESALESAGFDSEKVQRLRDAIANGAYPLDSMKISERFIELEKLL